MKVIEVNATYGYGSTGLIASDIGNELISQGDEVRYVYQMGKCDPSIGYQVGSPLDWKLHALYTRILGKQGWGSRIPTRRLLSYLDDQKPNLVHLHNLHANYINLPMLLKYLAKNDIATVITLHDCWFFTGKCSHFVSSGCERWKTGCGQCPKKNSHPRSLLFDQSAFAAKEKKRLFQAIENLTVVGCSHWITNLAKESFVLEDCRIEQIYNGVDTDVFTLRDRQICRKKLSLSAEYVMMGMAGKWLNPENRDVFEDVVHSLGANDILLLVGCTENQKISLKNYSKVLPLGFIKDRALLADYYNAADVFVNLTFEDNQPTVNMEAIACGTPVITYDSCGSPELVEEGKTGCIIPQKDGQALLSAWELIKRGEFDCQQCREIGFSRFNKEDRYKDYIALFKRIVDTREET